MKNDMVIEKNQVFMRTASEIAAAGKEHLPSEFISSEHMIYSSPATLAFNSPGAQGFGVKRAALALPESVMLLVAPGCCGRNTSGMMDLPEYRDRFFFLLMDETDIVTGRHLGKIADAVKEILTVAEKRPSAVMLCITCVDALLGTDMDRVCRKATEEAGIPVLPAYMYALTREGRLPPMVHVRQTIYSLLSPVKKCSTSMNILGEFTAFDKESELFSLLFSVGIRTIREIGTCRDFAEYQKMAEANFNLILNPEARYCAKDMETRLGIPSVEIKRMYRLEKIRRQYALLAAALGVEFSQEPYYEKAKACVDAFSKKAHGKHICVGEWTDADPFELSLALAEAGATVDEIYGTVSEDNLYYIRALAQISPDTRIYSNLSPTMMHYAIGQGKADVTIGRDAAYYHPEVPNVPFSQDEKPFGYYGLCKLLNAVMEVW